MIDNDKRNCEHLHKDISKIIEEAKETLERLEEVQEKLETRMMWAGIKFDKEAN